ncbi:hypothetical protein Syun_009604 [Stephania yunnanensis]|uniref:Uncharacterized protein n=1 Tax=Stephania yunnanensis TaxID=152371 RepID=A0AAP0KFW2_9MAGN
MPRAAAGEGDERRCRGRARAARGLGAAQASRAHAPSRGERRGCRKQREARGLRSVGGDDDRAKVVARKCATGDVGELLKVVSGEESCWSLEEKWVWREEERKGFVKTI